MSMGLLVDCDEAVAKWLLDYLKRPFFKYDQCIGIVDGEKIFGAVMFHGWNGADIEITYYGRHVLTLGIVRNIAIYALNVFDPARVTAVTSKRNRHLMRSLQKIGFKVEGAMRCHYGKRDCNRNTGVRFVIFREGIEKLANIKAIKEGTG